MQLFIGFDVGGTHIKHGVINENGEELTSDEYDTPDDESTFKEKWKAVVDKYCQEHEIASIGVSFPGHINHHTGEAAKAGALDYLDGENSRFSGSDRGAGTSFSSGSVGSACFCKTLTTP